MLPSDRTPDLLPTVASAVVGFGVAAGVIVGLVPVTLAALGGALMFIVLLPVRPRLVLSGVAAAVALTVLWAIVWNVSWALL